jgi:hypothetical protein
VLAALTLTIFPSVDFHLYDSVPPDKSVASTDTVTVGGVAKDTALAVTAKTAIAAIALNGATELRIVMRDPTLVINRYPESTRMC